MQQCMLAQHWPNVGTVVPMLGLRFPDLHWPSIGPTSALSSRCWANIFPTYIEYHLQYTPTFSTRIAYLEWDVVNRNATDKTFYLCKFYISYVEILMISIISVYEPTRTSGFRNGDKPNFPFPAQYLESFGYEETHVCYTWTL